VNNREKEGLISLYEDRYNQYGNDIRTVGWGNVDTQRLRFDILSDVADLAGKSICDLGCGFGDLYPYLVGRFGRIVYHGIDLSKKLIAEAERKHPEASFEVRDILQGGNICNYDFILCSGALNYRIEDNETYIYKMLCCMMDMAEEGISVNFLSSYADYSLEKNFHFSPEKAISMGKRISKFVSLRHDYPLHEFTLYLYRDPKLGN